MPEAPRVRRARETDLPELAQLLYLPAAEALDRVVGSRARALRVIPADIRAHGTRSMWVAALDGRVAGAMVAHQYGRAPAENRAVLRTMLRRTPPWTWPRVARWHWRGERSAPDHPADWLYVDALATDPAARRRGVASALLAHAEETARALASPAIALDTADTNAPALALYERRGFEAIDTIPAASGVPAAVVLVKKQR